MVYWRGRPIESLPRSDLEDAANEAIAELIGLRNGDMRRESYDDMVLSFLSGAIFCAIAVFAGFLLH
jgi:hypothetical protein